MSKKTNFLVIYMDDMGWKDLSCTGSTFYETPQIDRLAREGMIFANAYASCPVCSPARASFMTGQSPARLGVTDWIDPTGKFHPQKGKLIEAPYVKHLPKGQVTIAQALKEADYLTWHVGKWHLGEEEYYPEKCGFDVNIGGCFWGNPYNGYFSPYGIPTLADGPEGEYLTDRLTDEAIRLLQQRQETHTDKPFYLNLWHYTVHTPIQAKKEDIARFQKKAAELGLDQEQAIVEGEFNHTETSRNRRVTRRLLQSDPVYAAMLWNLDQNVGRLLKALEELGEADNTVVVLTSDNGGLATNEGAPTCNLPAAEGKGWMYEGGTRVAFLVRYPRLVKANTRCDIPVITMDLYPTFLELAGLPARPEQHCDGRSMVPLLEGRGMEQRPLFWHYPHYGNQGGTPGASVVYGRYKLIWFFEDDHLELYDLAADFGEKHNLAEELPEIRENMKRLLQGWQQEVCARFPEKNPDWKD